ncbi:MAG: L,D-transpeptidase family protein [Acidimicrobiia bacterium]|nr:L,D-transpeptidase family protein [Acidimicrobiia bacterium]
MPGGRGEGVAQLQRRLRQGHYWVGAVDGRYGGLTTQAVMALEKASGLPVDGVADAAVVQALDAPGPIVPRAAEAGLAADGDHVWVDKARQLLVVVRDGAVLWVFNTSTGTDEEYWHPTSGWQVADTPTGRFDVTWQVDGTSDGELGPLYRPKFFHSAGIAVHGSPSVPAVPASHGCVRVSNAAMDAIWAEGLMPLGSPVVVTGETPSN